jgi:predicted enzyme related to lactoylglutathione lyase
MPTVVSETFFSISVRDMKRAIGFYSRAFGATVAFESSGWTSLQIAGVRLGLALDAQHVGNRTGIHFAVGDLEAAIAEVERVGGSVVSAPVEIGPGVVMAEVADSEGNAFALNRR